MTSTGVLLTFLNSSTLEVALPAVTTAYDATPLQASWVLLIYMLVNTPLILAFGRLADLWGRWWADWWQPMPAAARCSCSMCRWGWQDLRWVGLGMGCFMT